MLKFELAETRGMPILPSTNPSLVGPITEADQALRKGDRDAARKIADKALIAPLLGRPWCAAVTAMELELTSTPYRAKGLDSLMAEKLYFTADAALIDRIGRELVGKQETGLLELVKNSYDADATSVTVTFEQDSLIIDDNGSGMNRQDLISGFLRLAGDMKIRKPTSEHFERRRAGRKGIGRFATQRLGNHLVLRTWNEPKPAGLELTINWRNFEQGPPTRSHSTHVGGD